MKYFTHISKTCESDAKNHGVLGEVQKLAQKIEKQQTIENLDIHDQFLKKGLGRSFRLIMGKKYDNEDCLLIFWRVFPKSASEYSNFCENTDPFLDKFAQTCNSENLDQIWSEKRISPDIPQLADLSEDERVYLYQQNTQESNEWMILESEDWIQRTDKESGEYSSYIGNLHPIILDLIENPQSGQETFVGNLGVLFRRVPEEKLLYLVAPVMQDRQNDFLALKNRYKKELLDSVNEEILLRRSKRAYPDFVVYESDIWIHGIQEKDDKANLALSKEEAAVLRSREDGYPLFINGRPGSGKSTVLQYLFAEHLYHHLIYKKMPNTPLYLTYNKELLDIAKESVFRILTSNASKFSSSRSFSDLQAREIVDHSFVDFREYLSSLLPSDRRYDKNKHIGFPEFRLLFDSKVSKHPNNDIRKITAELAWHVIRTYIKGTISEENEYLEPDVFRELPSKPQKSITATTYDNVYEFIWLKWYKDLCEKDGYWDDQDLARTLLMLDIQVATHSVIFCDEAQDFTRNELRIIFRLSLFSNRNLTTDVFQRIPFAFAGDPFQTLNPTGFDWESTSTTFYNAIINQLDKRQKPTLKLNYKELSFNYRSTRNIVQLCNFIHLMRGIAFGKKDLIPQKTWFDRAADMPVYFDVESPVLQSKLREQQEIVIIVPCPEGGEENYVRNDDFLKKIALSEDGQQVIRNVLSPMRAKGQEFSRVVIYKFGEECRKDYPELLKMIDPDCLIAEIPQENIIPLEYFVNRLYVSSSRAEKRLFIADTAAGLTEFWKFFEKYEPNVFIEKYKKSVQQKKENGQFSWSVDDLVKIQMGSQENWDKDHDDPAKLAEEFHRSGIRLKDTYKLSLAIQNYNAAGKKDKSLECKGWLLEFQGEYEAAGDCFEQLVNREKALQLYWQAEAFGKIISFGENSLENKAADFMIFGNKKSLNDSRVFLSDFAIAVKEGNVRPDPVWGKVIGTVIKYIVDANTESSLPTYEWGNLYKSASEFSQQGLLPNADDRTLDILKARSTSYPEKIEVLHKISTDPKQITDCYFQNLDILINDVQQDILYLALIKLGEFDETEKLLGKYPLLMQRKFAFQLASYIRDKQIQARIEPFVQKVFIMLTNQNSWDAALEFANKSVLHADEASSEVVKRYNWNYLLDVLFIKSISISDTLPITDKGIKNRISKYLSSKLLDRASAFYSTLTVAQSGAALERANMIRDCLEFYENIFDKSNWWPSTDDEKQFAKERWLVCKARQVDLQKDEKSKKRIQQDIQKKHEEWKISPLSSLPEYPVVDINEKPVPVTTPKPGRIAKEPKPKPPTVPVGSMDIHLKDTQSLPKLIDEISPYPTRKAQIPASSTVKRVKTETEKTSLEVTIKHEENIYRCSINSKRGKMTVHFNDEQEIITISAKNFKVSGSDEDIEEGIQKITFDTNRVSAGYYIKPWDLSCNIHQEMLLDETVVLADLYKGEEPKLHLGTFRIS